MPPSIISPRNAPPSTTAESDVRGTASQLIADAPPGAFDAQALLAAHPELCHDKSAVLDLAYEDFCRRTEAGEVVQPSEFAARFPRFRSSILHQLEAHRWAVCQASALSPPLVWPTAGEEFLGFQLIEELGRGAFARVFLAHEIALGQRPVVVKVSRLAGLEPQLLGRLRHPHIVPVFSAQQEARTGLWAICMPFFGRATLQDLVDRVPHDQTPQLRASLLDDVLRAAQCDLDTEGSLGADARRRRRRSYASEIVRLGVQMADALAHAHERAVYHCDLKPSNVLLTWSGARLLDFNLSLTGDAPPDVGGTLPYMAPERLLPAGGTSSSPPASPASDLFSLGVVLYQLLAGRLPWDPPIGSAPFHEAAAAMRARQTQALAWPEAAQRRLNPGLLHVVSSCLAFSPTYRPATARLLADALRRELRLPASGQRFMRLHRRGALAAMLGLAAAGLATAAGVHALPTDEEAGRFAFARGQFATAVRRFDAALRRQPDHHELRFLRARAQMLRGRFDAAQEDLALLKDLFPRHPYVSLGLGECQSRLAAGTDDFLRATAHYRDAAAAFPENGGLCNNLGYCELQLHHVRDALDWLAKAARFAPTQATCRFNLALAAIEGASRKVPLADLSRAYIEVLAAIALVPQDDQPRAENLHRLAADILAARVRRIELVAERRQEAFDAAARHLQDAWEWGCAQSQLESAIAAWRGIASPQEFAQLKAIVQQRQQGDPLVVPHLLDAFLGIDLSTRSVFP